MKIILVDDEGDLLQQAKIFLERIDDDIQVDTVASPRKALNMIEEEDYDAVICDYEMPDIDGLEFLEILRKDKDMDTPFIMFTGKGREEVAMKALNLGADRYIQKGGDPKSQYKVLMQALKQEVAHHITEEKIVELNSLLKSIRDVNQLIVQEDDIEILVKKSAKLLMDTRGYMNISISLVDEYGKLKPGARSGDHKEREWEINLDGEGNAPRCIKDVVKSTSIVHLKNHDERCLGCPYFEEDSAHQTMLIPMVWENELLGILDICHKPEHIITKEEKDLLEEVVDDLSFAIDKLKTERMLKESEEKFHTLAKSMPAVIYLCKNDKRYTMLFLNEAIEDMTGYPKEKFLEDEMSIVDIFHPDDVDKLYKELDKAVENRSVFHLEYRIKDAEGNTRWLEEFGKAIYEDGDAKYLVGSIHDMTEVKKVERELKESKQRLELAIKGAELGIWDWNIKKREVKYNERSAEMLGSSVDELNGPLDYWEERVHPEDLPRVNRKVKTHLRGETEIYKTEHRLKTKSGEWIWVKNVGKVCERVGDGEPVRAIGIHEDITKRKISEQQLEKSEEKFRTIFESANDAILVFHKGRFIDCNQKTLEMFGCERDDIIGKAPHDFSPEKQPDGIESSEIAKEKINLTLEGKPQKFEWVHTTKDEKKFYADINLNLYVIDDERYVMAIVRDIDERKKAEQHIEENKNKIERLHEISAELQTCDSEEEVCSLAIKAAEDILDFIFCDITTPEGDEMVSQCKSRNYHELTSTGNVSLKIDDSLAGKTHLENSSYIVKDLRTNEYAKPLYEEFKSALNVPIGNNAVFQAISTEVGHFDEDDLRIAKLLMNHVSGALDRIDMKKREEFLHSLLRHDVGNKNQIIKGYLELLKDYEISDEAKEFLRKAEYAAKDSIEMIEKIRKLRQIEQEDEVYDIPLDTVIDKVMSENQAMLQEKDIEVDLNECGSHVRGGHLLEEMFSNLIGNSIQHSNCNKIKISSKNEEDECIVTIEDDGSGIPDDIKEKIFEKGFKSGTNAGTGLGLYMVREIAESYGGSVEVKDSEMGGARFDVHLKKLN